MRHNSVFFNQLSVQKSEEENLLVFDTLRVFKLASQTHPYFERKSIDTRKIL